MPDKRVLYIVHNHPSVRPGGAEQYALELYDAVRDAGEWEPFLVAKAGPPISPMVDHHAGTIFSRVGDDPHQYFAYTDGTDYDWILGTSPHKDLYTQHFRDLLLALRPHVVHFQHTVHLGYDLVRAVRRTLPDVPIVYTLHEYLPICHRDGQMVRTTDEKPCLRSTPRQCHACFPDIPPETFFLRTRLIQSHLAAVDLFVAPSRFLAERFVAWGIPRERIVVEEYGRRLIHDPHADAGAAAPARARNRFGYFGQLSWYKGVTVALEAMGLLQEQHLGLAPDRDGGSLSSNGGDGALPSSWARGLPHLFVYGANLDLQPGFFQRHFHELVSWAAETVTYAGAYRSEDVGRLMSSVDWVVVPSVWWENSPLVIQEAFACRRPVICSDIGGMAEKVTDGVNGIHFAAADATSLASKIAMAAGTPGLWDRLRSGIPDVYRISDHVDFLCARYDDLLRSANLTAPASP
jgi:glycosyltransferase involved in cell wall biosynthesis